MNNKLSRIERFGRYGQWIWIPLAILTLSAAAIIFTQANRSVFIWINGWSEVTGKELWAVITMFGDTLLISALLILWIRRRPDVVCATLIAAIVAATFVHTLKPLFDIPRPPAVFGKGIINVIGPGYRSHAFPSGHTATIFTFAGVLCFSVRSSWIKVLLLVFASIAGISRICVGVHWPLDVAGGAFIGIVDAWIGVELAMRTDLFSGTTARKIFGAILLFAAFYLLCFYRPKFGNLIWFQRFVALVCLTGGIYEYVKIFRGCDRV